MRAASRDLWYFDLVLCDAPFPDMALDLTVVISAAQARDPLLLWLQGLLCEVAGEAGFV